MAAFTCKTCMIDYPDEALGPLRECPVCQDKTVFNPSTPSDEGWEVKVTKALVEKGDPTIVWRFAQLMHAGYSPARAEEMAHNKTIDLHRAVEMAKFPGHDLAYEILA